MKTQMVIRMEPSSEKGHSKAMRIAAETDGVESVTLAGKDRSLLVVGGDGVDCNDLTTKLRRKVGRANVVELRTLHNTSAGFGYGHYRTGPARDVGYGNTYSGYPAGGYAYATAPASEYYGHRPAYANYSYNPPPYAGTVEYYPAGDQNGCCIM